MKQTPAIFLIFLLLFTVGPVVKGQEVPKIPINTVVERVQKYFNVYPLEKVHMHFDKPYYAVGDTLWFKTYMLHNQLEYEPSKIAYVDIINGRDSLIQTLRIPLKDNGGEGYFVLDPQVIKQDNYRFRAYTKYMMNFDMAYFFNKVVTVGDAINKKLGTEITFLPEGNKTKATLQFRDAKGTLLGRKKLTWETIDGWDPFDKGKAETDDMGRVTISFASKDKNLLKKGRLLVKLDGDAALVGDFPLKDAIVDVDFQLFPEGGDLIAAVPKKVAFKAVGAHGKGLAVKGRVIDSKKQQVAEFADFGLGMGYFEFTPVAGETYKAVVTLANNQERTFDFPAVKNEGLNVVSVKTNEGSMTVGLATNDSYFSTIQNQPFYLFGQMNGHLIYGAQVTLKSPSLSINIPTVELPNGIVQLSLLTAQGKVISERLVFNEAAENLNLQVKSDKANYGRKEQVKLNLANLTTEKLPSSISISVIDEAKVPFDDQQENGILSSLLLTSDLIGFIERPGFYFDANAKNRKEALDALLMTQGYRRFVYEDLIAEQYPKLNFLPEQAITLSGTLRLNTGRTYPNGGLLLSVPSRGLRKDAYTDRDGRFVFDNLSFPDSSKVTINARSNDNYRNIVINMDQSFYPAIDENNPYKANDVLNIDKEMVSYLNNSKNEFRTSILIDEVAVVAPRKVQRTSKEFSSLTGLSMAEHRIEGERFSGCNVLTMCLNTILTGVTYDAQTLKYYLTRSYNQGSRVPVQFFLNGMPIDENALNAIAPAEIEAVEIFTRDDLGTVSRLYNNDGVVSIITKKEAPKGRRMSAAEIEAVLPKTNIIDFYPLGFIKERKFYTPKYDTPQTRGTNDYRTTLYWNPDVKLDEKGEAVLDFYNGDGNGKYKVVVEGMDLSGKVGRTVYYYNVN